MIKARQVLQDCKLALQHADLAIDPEDFRISWAALVVLLRAVGHVLDKVDGRGSPRLRDAIDRRWQLWRDDRVGYSIFWDFIEEERNNVLKAYEFGYEEDDAEILSVQDGTAVTYSKVPVLSRLRAGPFAGQPGREVARHAIAWWTDELDAIEKAAYEHGA